MTRQLVLWGPPTIPAQPGETATRREVDRWVERCANVGVTRMISAGMKPMTVAAAHRKGIEADPYVNYTAFPSYGSRPRNQGWSTAYLRVPPTPRRGGRYWTAIDPYGARRLLAKRPWRPTPRSTRSSGV